MEIHPCLRNRTQYPHKLSRPVRQIEAQRDLHSHAIHLLAS
jgi:hypothetical protein